MAGRSTESLELMGDDRDYFQRQVEKGVHLSEPVRATLAVVVIVGGVLLILLGAVLLFVNSAKMPSSAGGMFLAAVIMILGLGSAYIGARLLLLPSENAHLLGPHGTRIASCLVAIVGVMTIVGSVFARNLYFSASGLGTLLVAFWLYTSAKRIRE